MENTNITVLSKSLEEHYLKSDFVQLKKLLLQSKEAFEPGIFHYNLGTVYAKMNDPATGRYHLERALNEGEYSGKAFHNLQVLKSTLSVADISTSESIIDQTLNYSLLVPTSIFLSLTLLCVIGILFIVRLKILKKLVFIVILLMVSCFPLAAKLLYFEKMNFAVALKESSLRDGPSQIYPETQKLKAGVKLIVSDVNNGWFLVSAPYFYSGWIHRDFVGLY